MTQSQPLVSVVMPVYNGAGTIDRAIRSVLAQTWRNLECVVVDNASSDATAEILAGHAARDARLRVHRNPQVVPVMQNHNVAVEQMSADAAYCQILQADDTLEPDCLRRKVALGERHPSVGIIGAYSDRGGQRYPTCMPEGECMQGEEACRRTLLGEFYPFVSPSAVLFRGSLARARRPFYNEAVLHGDVQACYEILAESDLGFVHDELTRIGVSAASVTSRENSPLNRLLASNLDLLIDYGPRYLDEATYQARLTEQLDTYYRQLAWAVVDRRERGFWEYHRQALAASGNPLAVRRLLTTLLREMRKRPRDGARRLAKSFGYG